MRMKSLSAPSICPLPTVHRWSPQRAGRHTGARKSVYRAFALCLSALLLAGCGLLSGPEEEAPTPMRLSLPLVPTFTPMPVDAPAAQGDTGGAGAVAPQPAPTATQAQAAPPTDTPAPPATQAPTVARFTVKTDLGSPTVNVRAGPSTAFTILGAIARGAQFDISGRNAENSWYEFCCVNGQKGWIFARLVTVENPQLITLAQNIPATPVPPPTPVPPTATPVPVVNAPPRTPCGGGDGCKFRLRDRDFGDSGGHVLRLYIGFVHGGRGDEIQGVGGNYYVGLFKDGAPVSAVNDDHHTRGRNADQAHQGPKGKKYNYLKEVRVEQLPGGKIAGAYMIWVKDGNGERDSDYISFTLNDKQGDVWFIFDQNR